MKHLWLVLLIACGSRAPAAQKPIENTSTGTTQEVGPPDEDPGSVLDVDKDGDGVNDRVDLCPADPEDFDGFEDTDGCPDPDNDKDSILDIDDQCPNEPEVMNGQTDDDGCPP